MFNAATGALNSKTNLKKVVLMTHIPRYDLKQDDPMSLKPVLSQLYNNTILQLWIHSPLKNKLFIGSHNLDCTGGIKASRYHNIQRGLYDGIHMFGSSGMKAYTNSVINILQSAEITKTTDSKDDHSNCEQFQYQNRRRNKNGYPSFTQAQPSQYQKYSVPTKNTFNILGN